MRFRIIRNILSNRNWIIGILLFASISRGFGQTTLFSEDFESYAIDNSLSTSGSNQWLQYNITAGSTSWAIGGTGTYCIAGSRSLTMYNNNSSSYYAYRTNRACERVAYYSQLIDATQYHQLRLNFSWRCRGENGYDYGQVVYSLNGTTWNPVSGTQYQGQNNAQTVTNLDLSVVDGQSFYIGFRWINDNNTGDNPPFTVDDISLTGVINYIDYFSVGNGNANLTTSWRNASNTNPTNFTSANQRFIIRNGHSMTTSADWTISGAGTSLYIQNGTLTATNNISLSAATNFQIDDGSTYNHNVNNNLVWAGTESFTSGSTVNYGFAGTQTITGGITYGNLTISNSGTKTLGGAISVNGNLTISGSATLASDQYQITGNATGALSMGAGTTLSLGSSGSANNVLFPTNYTNANIALNNSSTVIYQANGAQSVSANPPSYGNLTISGGNTKTLQGAVTVNGTLNLNSGNISLGTHNLTIGVNGSITGTFNNTHMVVCSNTGSLIRLGDAVSDFNMTYPIGTGTVYAPMTISSFTGTITNPASITVNSATPHYSAGGAVANDLNRYWTVNTNNLSGISANVSFAYAATDVPGTESSYETSFYSGGNWSFLGLVTSATHTASASSVSNLSGVWTARKPANTYYSYQSGSWSNVNTWTTDASGTLWVNAAIPGPGDNVVILNGRTVTGPTTSSTIGSLEIREGGILDIGTTTHNFGIVRGQGKLRLKSNIFPSGTFNEFVAAGGGTVEYYDIGTLPIPAISHDQLEYNNLIISKSTAVAQNAYLDNFSNGITYTINGNFDLLNTSSGTLTFSFGNPAASDNLINMIVYGNFTVNTGCNIRVNNFATNTHNYAGSNAMDPLLVHTLNLFGDLTNNGSIRFTGRSSTWTNNYYTRTTNSNYEGDVQVYFRGATNNTLTCNGVTDFFRLIVEKGTDQTYTLEVNSSGTSNFALYGPNNQGNGKTGGPEGIGWGYYYKALFMHYGTLILNENINVPSLSEGGVDAIIYPTAALWINGATVSSTVSGFGAGDGAYQGLMLCGRLQISAGSLNTGDATGLVFYTLGTPELIIEETGSLDVSQVWVDPNADNKISYIQTGGSANMRLGGQNQANSVMLDLSSPNSVFIMSGGEINFTNNSLSGGNTCFNVLDIESQEGNYQVTGGTLNFNLPSNATTYEANSTVPFYNLNISRISGGGTTTVRWDPSGKNSGTNSNLTVLNDLSIGANTVLDLGVNNIDLNVGGDFTINGTYTTGNINTTTFNGSGNQTLDLRGTCTFNHLALAGTSQLTLNNANPATPIVANGNFTIGSGCTLIDNGRILQLAGTTGTVITNNGTHFKPASGAGSIRLTGTALQTITGNGSGKFNNLTLYKTGGTVTMSSDMMVTGELRLAGTTNGAWNKLNIGANHLNLDSLAVVYSDLNTTAAVFNNNRMIQTGGLMSDGGVSKKYTSAAASFTFPFGINGYYLPAFIQFSSAPAKYGIVTTRPVQAIHPLAQTGNILGLYWKTESEGFNGVPVNTVRHQYTYNDAFLNGTETSYIPGFYNTSAFSWSYINNTSLVEEGPNLITYGTASSADGDFTAGYQAAFGAVTALYSIANGPWNSASTWSTTRNGTAGTVVPTGLTMALIVDGHTVTVTADNANAGGLYIESGSTLDLRTYTGHNFEAIPNNKVSGSGTLRIGSNNYFPQGDFGNFIGPDGGTVEYYTSAAVTAIVIPPVSNGTGLALSTYKNLILNTTSGTNHSITLPTLPVGNNLTIYGNMTVMGNGNAMNSGARTPATSQQYIIEGDLNILSGLLEYRSGVVHTFTVKGNTNIFAGGKFGVNTNASATNILNLYGNLTNNGLFDMNNTGSVLAYFRGTSNDSIKGSGTTYEFYNLTVDKGSDATPILYLQSVITTGFNNPFLTLINGTFRVDGPAVPVSTGSFSIPQTACFSVQSGSATIGTTVNLSGKLESIGGTIDIGDDIEYAAAGTPTIEVSGGTLNVNGQIRRLVDNTSGALIYRQTNGDVLIRGAANQPTRAKLEITNLNSRFEMLGGNITLLSAGGTTYYDLYLRPETYVVTGGTINLGNATGGQNFGVVASAPIWNLNVGTAAVTQTATLNILPLTVLNQLTIYGNSVFNANGFDVNLRGGLTNNNSDNTADIVTGGFRPGSLTQTTTFYGTANQSVTGNGSNLTNFANLLVNKTAGTVTLGANSDIRVNKDLTITSGTLADNQNIIQLSGNVTNNGIHSSTGLTGGLHFIGTLNQQISGNGLGEFGNITLNNPVGVDMIDNSRINGQLTFTSGSLYIDDYLLTLGPNATISGTPGNSRMITTNGVLSDKGVKKIYNSGNTPAFTYPVGISGKYTPVLFDFSANSSSNSEITIIPVNELHRSVTGTPTDYLKYYWNVIPANLGTYTVNYQFNYSDKDIVGTESNFIPQRYDIPGNVWYTNLPVGTISTAGNTLSYSGISANLSGEYTAAQTFTAQGMLYSITNGNWGTAGTWSYTAGGGSCGCTPSGHPVTISAGTTVTMATNSATAYSVTINGTLNASTTTFHNLGHVDGPGTLVLTATTDGMFVFPGGEYDGFMNNPLSTVEFTGTNNGTLPLKPGNEYKPYQNVIFSGTGIKYMSAENLKIQGNMIIRSAAIVTNTLYNKNLTLLGDWTDEHTTSSGFIPGTGTVFMNGINGSQDMFLGYTESFYNLSISNPSGVNVAAGNAGLTVDKYLYLTLGNFHTEAGKLITINNTSTTAVIGGGSSSFVDGPLSKKIISGQSFAFPVGEGTRYGQVVLLNTNASPSPAIWTATYKNADPNANGYLTGTTHYNSPISAISNNEYWIINRPSGGSANVRIRWDASSYPGFTSDAVLRSRLRIAEYDNAGVGLWTERGSLVSGDATAGTISTTIPVTQDDYIFSIGIIGVTAAILTPPASYSICNNGAIATIPLSLSGTAPWVLQYRTSGATTTNFTQTLNTPEINLTGSDIGGYSATPYTLSLVSVKDATNTTGTVAPTQVQITVLQTYVPSISGSTSVGTGETRTYSTTSHTGSTYAWSWVSAPAGSSIVSPSAASTNITFGTTTTGTFQLQVTETSAAPASCSVTSVISITISNTPTPSITPTTENICIGSAITYQTQYNAGNFYTWTVVNGTCTGCGTERSGSAAAASITVTWNSTGSGSVSVTERSGSITGSATNSYSISAMPVNKTLVENAICNGQNGNITVVGSEANISYQLYRYDDNITVGTAVSGIAATNINLPTGILTTSTNYYVTAYNEGCSLRIPASGYVTETVYSIPVPSFTGPNSICSGDAAVYQTTAGMTNYVWTISPAGSGVFSGPSDAASVTITWESVASGLFEDRTLTLEYTENGCASESPAEMTIRVLKVPETGPTYRMPNN